MLNFNKVPVGVVLIDNDKITHVNKKATTYYELNKPEIQQVGPSYFFNNEEYYQKYKEFINMGNVGTIKTINRTAEGLIHLDIHVGYLIENEKKYIMLVIIEVNSIERIKKLLQKKNQIISALPEFIVNMRSLLTIVYGYSQLLKLKLIDHETYQFVDDLDISIKYTTELFDKMYKTMQDEEITMGNLENIYQQTDKC